MVFVKLFSKTNFKNKKQKKIVFKNNFYFDFVKNFKLNLYNIN